MKKACKPTPKYMLIVKSSNHKTGKMAVSTSPHETCPAACPFKENGCYAATGPLAMWFNRCSKNKNDDQEEWQAFLDKIKALPAGSLLRHNQAGDLVGDKKAEGLPDEIDHKRALELVEACKESGVRGYTYTHYPVIMEWYKWNWKDRFPPHYYDTIFWNKHYIELMNKHGFTVNVSSNSMNHADRILDDEVKAPVCTLVSSDTKEHVLKTPKGRTVVVCPAVWKEGMTCDKCQACMNPNRKTIIAFPAHGSRKKRCDEVIRESEELWSKVK